MKLGSMQSPSRARSRQAAICLDAGALMPDSFVQCPIYQGNMPRTEQCAHEVDRLADRMKDTSREVDRARAEIGRVVSRRDRVDRTSQYDVDRFNSDLRSARTVVDTAVDRHKSAVAEYNRTVERYNGLVTEIKRKCEEFCTDQRLKQEQAALAEAAAKRQRRLDQEAGRESFRVARARELHQAQRGRDIQSVSSDGRITAKVKAGWSRDHNMPCTDILIEEQGVKGHHHIVIGEDGQTLIDEWRHG